MIGFMEAAESSLLYAVVIIGILFVLGFALVYLRKSDLGHQSGHSPFDGNRDQGDRSKMAG